MNETQESRNIEGEIKVDIVSVVVVVLQVTVRSSLLYISLSIGGENQLSCTEIIWTHIVNHSNPLPYCSSPIALTLYRGSSVML